MKIKAGLSPMAGFTDAPFRVICSEMGADYTVTEMVSAVAVCYGDKKTFALSGISPLEAPCAIQIFGHDPEMMAHAAEVLIEKAEVAPCAIDVNMGCPVRKIVSSGDGSALMKTPPLAAQIVKKVKEVTEKHGLPLWVKIRAGWDKKSINAPYFASVVADAGADRITVHGRTRDMMYAPSSDNAVIRAVREAVPSHVEIVGNGDVASLEDAVRMINETECDAVAIGRAALGDPWIFRALKGDGTPPTKEERLDVALRLTRDVISVKGETSGVREARGRAAHFIRGMRGSGTVRDELNHAETYEEFKTIIDKLRG